MPALKDILSLHQQDWALGRADAPGGDTGFAAGAVGARLAQVGCGSWAGQSLFLLFGTGLLALPAQQIEQPVSVNPELRTNNKQTHSRPCPGEVDILTG